MSTVALSSVKAGAATYGQSSQLAPYQDAIITRTGDKTALVKVILDPRHASLLIDLEPLGNENPFVPTDGSTSGPADVLAVVMANSGGAPAMSQQLEFAVNMTSTSVDAFGMVGLDPDSCKDDGTPKENSAISGNGDSVNGDDPLPITVIVRKKRIPVPPGIGQSSISLFLVAAVAFATGFALGALIT